MSHSQSGSMSSSSLTADEKQKRKAEIRARLEREAQGNKKRGFLTPARKRRLRALLRIKTDILRRKEQERKAEERRQIILERTGKPKSIEGINEPQLHSVVKEYFDRFCKLENEKYDLEYECNRKEFEIREISSIVNNQRGKFKPPPLKKVSKMAQQMAKIALFTAKASQSNYAANLKQVKKFARDEDEKKYDDDKPEWSKGKSAPTTPKAESDVES